MSGIITLSFFSAEIEVQKDSISSDHVFTL